MKFDFSAGLLVAGWATPGPVSLGGLMGVTARFGSWSIGLEGHGLGDVIGATKELPVSTSVWTGAVVPCRTIGAWAACGILTAGLRHYSTGQGDVINPSNVGVFAVGARASYDRALWPDKLILRMNVDASIQLPEGRITEHGSGGQVILWSSKPLRITGGVSVVAPF
jgi:hypothetical protein